MLEQITWNNYFTAVAIILVIYYLLIAILYYRSDISDKLKKQMQARAIDLDESEEEPEAPSSFDELEAIVANIKGSLEEGGTGASKEELLGRLGEILAGYEGLDNPAFRVAINNYIIGHAKKLSDTGFSEEELNAHWQKIRSR